MLSTKGKPTGGFKAIEIKILRLEKEFRMDFPPDSKAAGHFLPSEAREMLSHVDAKVNFHVQYDRVRALESEKAALVFAQNSIKTSQILNGGGLIAIPAFVSLFNISVQANQNLLVESAMTFTAGLVFAWLSNLIGYFSETNKYRTFLNLAEAKEQQIRHIYENLDKLDAAGKSDAYITTLKQGRKNALKFNSLRYSGTFLLVVSMQCFVVGAFLGYRVITENPQGPPRTASSAVGPTIPVLPQTEK